MASKFKPIASSLAKLQPADVEAMAKQLGVSHAGDSIKASEKLAEVPSPTEPNSSDISAASPAPLQASSASRLALAGDAPIGTPAKVDAVEYLNLLKIGQVALVALHLISENKHNARVFYLASDIDATAVSMQKNQQLSIATGWIEDGKLLLNDGQKRARAARAGGIPHLKVEITSKPDPRSGYLASRAMNVERSNQTCLDDAVRWKEMLADGLFTGHADLATALDMTQPNISKTLAINEIPNRLINRMKDNQATSSLRVAYEISRIFARKMDSELDSEKLDALADDVIDEVIKRNLSSEICQARRQSRSSNLA